MILIIIIAITTSIILKA